MAFSFRDIDDTLDEYSIGWVSLLNMFDSDFSYASYAAGDYVTLTMRVDERKVSPAVLKKVVAKEEERIKVEKQIPRISRSMKVEIKERVLSQLMRKSVPVPATYDLYWSLSDSTVLFFSTSRKSLALLEDLFKDTFGLSLILQFPYLTAERLISPDQESLLENLKPAVLI
jgi:DNA recombination-dependent growth factor C